MQKITIIGRIGRNVAVRETESGNKVLGFSVAVNSRVRGVDKTSWYEVSSFNYERYKNMVPYLTKGSSVIVVGDLDADIEEGKDGKTRCRREIIADCIDFNSGGTSGNTVSTKTAPATSPAKEEEPEEEMEVTTKPKARRTVKVQEPVVEETVATEEPGEDGVTDDLPF